MGIVSEPWSEGKGLVATNYRDTSGNRGRTEGQGRQSEPPAGRRRPAGTDTAAPPRGAGRGHDGQADRRRADSRGVQGGGREVARPEDGDEAQAPRVAHRALADVHARQAEHEGGHGLGSCGSGRWHHRNGDPFFPKLNCSSCIACT